MQNSKYLASLIWIKPEDIQYFIFADDNIMLISSIILKITWDIEKTNKTEKKRARRYVTEM